MTRNKKLDIAKQMPPLKRKSSKEAEYDPENDQIIQWIKNQPDLINFLLEKLASWGYIVFESNTRTWRGVDYRGD